MAPQQQQPPQSSSRLSRLLTLLDTGSTQGTRFAAARQIGDIVKSHPQDLNSLLKKVSQYLRRKNWDTRVAAAHAVGAIAEGSKYSTFTELCTYTERKIVEGRISWSVEEVATVLHPNTMATLPLRSFDINKVLGFGALLASEGQEFDIAHDTTKNPKERLAHQKSNLRRRLGLDVCEQFMDFNDMIKDEDLLHKLDPQAVRSQRFYGLHPGNNVQQLVAKVVPNSRSRAPSARELNLLKRKAKVTSKDQMKGRSDDREAEASRTQTLAQPSSPATSLNTSKANMDAATDDDSSEHDMDGRWPFHDFVEQLLVDMFDPVWEVRHGSCMALREILMHQGGSAGLYVPDLSSIDEGPERSSTGINLPLKREAEDYSIEVTKDEFGHGSKRLKVEESSVSFLNMYANVSHGGDNVVSTGFTSEANVDSLNTKPVSLLLDLKHLPGEDSDMANASNPLEENKTIIGSFEDYRSLTEGMDMLSKLSGNARLLRLVGLTRQSWVRHCDFLQDCAIRFLCVLSLDRFGDYVSDQVVAPVRETCAQALGAVLKYMAPELVHETLNILLQIRT